MDDQSVKKRTIEHWSQTPIGTQTDGFGSVHEPFSRRFFEDHAQFRYSVYAPWLPDVAGFGRYAGRTILEVGCGMGTDLLEFARGGANVVGCDLTPRHLELARRRFVLFEAQALLVNGDAERLSFADESFDMVYSNGVLHHTPETQTAVDEIFRVLKPGGEAVILLYHRHSLQYYMTILLKSGSRRFVGRILRGKNPFTLTASGILSASTDGETNPLTKVYSREEGKALMKNFDHVTTDVYHLNRNEVFLGWLIPKFLYKRLARSVGWYLVLRGKKPVS